LASVFEISFEGDHVLVRIEGEKSIEGSTKLFTALIAACDEYQCFDILGISNATSPMPVDDGYQHADMFKRLGFDNRYRLAWVEQTTEAVSATYFVETVLVNRGLPGRLFNSVSDAKAWLLNKDPQQETT